MKVLTDPVSPATTVPHSRSKMPTMPPSTIEFAGRGQRHVAVNINGRHVASVTHANLPSRTTQRARRNSAPRHWMPDAKVNKPTGSRTKVGLWLENVDSSDASPPSLQSRPPSSPETVSTRWKSLTPSMSSSDPALFSRDSESPRIPLADITPLVLAAESSSSLCSPDVSSPEPQSPKRHTFSAPDLDQAVNMLTADQARQLLLVSAQSNTWLAYAIKKIAIHHASQRSTRDAQQSYLADTFIYDERYIPAEC
ncbi:hypothetical protein C7999DRAFT_17428 [Corynascus novoguineensis]|uniref:Uncharacterized protein n=1 Tax=Corynascus novoguineensis TaxID=1126955 RepID=A0AAN7HJE3_9PEZI|nr:hypothetical protein C7999DRAFT_17428 [Corynascus novoguineensis]